MQTTLAPWIKDAPEGVETEEILRRCVHCGFCLATCPTYLELGDELDSPRGRIYLIKQMLEDREVSASTQLHLDRCLTCRNCETTCPSGVEYGKLVDIGREVAARKVARPLEQQLLRKLLSTGLNSALFAPAMTVGRLLRTVLPRVLRDKVPPRQPVRHPRAKSGQAAKKVILLQGCVQPAMMPSIDEATIRVLSLVGIDGRAVPGAGCCGAMLREYAHHLRHDAEYADKAGALSAAVRDIAEVLVPHAGELAHHLGSIPGRFAFHPPCTLQHWQKLRASTEDLLRNLGFQLVNFGESHLCCGSAGTYSITQPELADSLRARKLGHILEAAPDAIISSNIGCITHLQAGSDIPVRHWVEVVDDALTKQ